MSRFEVTKTGKLLTTSACGLAYCLASDTRLLFMRASLRAAITFAEKGFWPQALYTLGAGLHAAQDYWAHRLPWQPRMYPWEHFFQGWIDEPGTNPRMYQLARDQTEAVIGWFQGWSSSDIPY